MTGKLEKQSHSKPRAKTPKRWDIDAELDALAAETAPFIAQLDEEWRKDMAEIDARLAREQVELDAAFPDLPGLEFDFSELDELLGLGNLPDFPFDLPAIRSREPQRVPEKPAHARHGVRGRWPNVIETSMRRKNKGGQTCKAPATGKRRRCRMHGGKSTGPKTPEGRAKSLSALRSPPCEKRPVAYATRCASRNAVLSWFWSPLRR